MIQRIARRVTASMAGLALAAAGFAALAPTVASATTITPSSYTAAGTPAYHLTGDALQPQSSLHACTPVTSSKDTTRKGVFCADVIDNEDGTFFARGEASCQLKSTGQKVQCDDISLSLALWSPTGELEFSTFQCGHTNGACPSGSYVKNGGTAVGCGQEVWAVVDVGSTIRLPVTAAVASLSANWSSGHTTTCT